MSLILLIWFIYLIVIIPARSADDRGFAALTACFVILTTLLSLAIAFLYLQDQPITTNLNKETLNNLIPFVEFKDYSFSTGPQLSALLIGTPIAFILALIFFGLIGYFSSIYIIALHEDVSYWEAFKSFVFLILNMQLAWLLVENGEVTELNLNPKVM
jgi:hypothetical protein